MPFRFFRTCFPMFLLLAPAVLPLVPVSVCANSLNELRGLKTRESRLPVYHKNRLQLMIYSAEAERQGDLIITTGPVMDIIRRDADIDLIDNTRKTVLYPLNAPLADVLAFWAQRLYSEGVISSTRADINQENQQAAGGEPVFFRSPLLDLDGVGFDADYSQRTLSVRKNVRIVLRTAASNPANLLKSGKIPEKYEFINAYADSLYIDFNKGEIILRGHVKINEERATVTCDRLLIYLDRNDRNPENSSGADPFAASGVEGISKIICEGHVVIDRQLAAAAAAEPRQRATADRVEYLMQSGLITLTGLPDNPPTLHRGNDTLSGETIEIHRNTEQMAVRKNCRLVFHREDTDQNTTKRTDLRSDALDMDYRKNSAIFTGNVVVEDPDMQLTCRTMNISFRTTEPHAAAAPATDTTLMPGINAGGKRELAEIVCHDDVRVVRRGTSPEGGERAEAAQAVLDYTQRKVTLSGAHPRLVRGDDSLTGEQLILWLNEERLCSPGDSRIVLCSAPAPGKAAVQTVITSDSSDLDYGGNLLTFKGNVKVRDPRMTLDCDEMKIHLKNAPGEKVEGNTVPAADSSTLGLGSGNSGNKLLDRIVCTGKVHAEEKRMKLDCDVLTLHFQQASGDTPEPGALQSGKTQLIRINTDGNVRLESRSDTLTQAKTDAEQNATTTDPVAGSLLQGTGGITTLTADRGQVDLLKNVSEFHGKVRVEEPRATLDCDSLYLHARAVTPGAVPATPPIDDIDRDPFAATATEVPNTIGIGDTRELTDVIAQHHVTIVRKLPSGIQRAIGDRAHYTVADRTVTLTGTPQELPILEDPAQGRMKGKRIRVDLASERATIDEQVSLEVKNLNSLQL